MELYHMRNFRRKCYGEYSCKIFLNLDHGSGDVF